MAGRGLRRSTLSIAACLIVSLISSFFSPKKTKRKLRGKLSAEAMMAAILSLYIYIQHTASSKVSSRFIFFTQSYEFVFSSLVIATPREELAIFSMDFSNAPVHTDNGTVGLEVTICTFAFVHNCDRSSRCE